MILKAYFFGVNSQTVTWKTFNWDYMQLILSEKYDINLRYPNLPVAKIGGKGAMLPFELLKIAPKQRYQKKELIKILIEASKSLNRDYTQTAKKN